MAKGFGLKVADSRLVKSVEQGIESSLALTLRVCLFARPFSYLLRWCEFV